ncbi:P-loop containing nucleoside triphosphate hydrolase protein [Trichophaea hybrida]|nr:P-loop containing nucleoside triphosphate hydrolase protein [Trichophaea hybrida]
MTTTGTNLLLSHILNFLSPPRFSPSKTSTQPPTIIALSGPQGSGKTTITHHLATAFRAPPYSLYVAVLSIDDLYLRRHDQLLLAAAHPDNKLFSHRGEPGTHDLALAARVFDTLLSRDDEVVLPVFDKSLHDGAGNRIEGGVSVDGKKVDVLIFEGWCVGFRALQDDEVVRKYEQGMGSGNPLESLLEVNNALKGYDVLTDRFDLLIHIDAEDIGYVYEWRLQQEHAMIAAKGMGMSDAQVVEFVDGYMPGYELYVENLRKGAFKEKGRQLRVVIGRERETVKVEEL